VIIIENYLTNDKKEITHGHYKVVKQPPFLSS